MICSEGTAACPGSALEAPPGLADGRQSCDPGPPGAHRAPEPTAARARHPSRQRACGTGCCCGRTCTGRAGRGAAHRAAGSRGRSGAPTPRGPGPGTRPGGFPSSSFSALARLHTCRPSPSTGASPRVHDPHADPRLPRHHRPGRLDPLLPGAAEAGARGLLRLRLRRAGQPAGGAASGRGDVAGATAGSRRCRRGPGRPAPPQPLERDPDVLAQRITPGEFGGVPAPGAKGSWTASCVLAALLEILLLTARPSPSTSPGRPPPPRAAPPAAPPSPPARSPPARRPRTPRPPRP